MGSPDFFMEPPLLVETSRATVIAGRGTARMGNGRLAVDASDPLDFIWMKIE